MVLVGKGSQNGKLSLHCQEACTAAAISFCLVRQCCAFVLTCTNKVQPGLSGAHVRDAVKALHIIIWQPVALRCAVCALQNYWELHDNMLIAPYVAGSADVSKPLAHFKQPVLPLAERKWLLHFRGGCLPYGFMFPNQTKIVTGKVSTTS